MTRVLRIYDERDILSPNSRVYNSCVSIQVGRDLPTNQPTDSNEETTTTTTTSTRRTNEDRRRFARLVEENQWPPCVLTLLYRRSSRYESAPLYC